MAKPTPFGINKLRTFKKPKHKASDFGGSEVLIKRCTKQIQPFRIATISWSLDDRDVLPAQDFLDTLSQINKQDQKLCDLIITAGRIVTGALNPKEILDKTGGAPVIFEMSLGKKAPWILVYFSSNKRASLKKLRFAQIVGMHNQKGKMAKLARVIAKRNGIVRFEGIGLSFVLFICGENNALNCNGKKSVIKYVPKMLGDHLMDVLGGNWIMLNPAHGPYRSKDRRTGFAKIGPYEHGRTPTLKRLVEQYRNYKDGTRSPLAVIHCNNFNKDKTITKKYASCAFGKNIKKYIKEGNKNGLQWKYVVYELTLNK